MTKISISLIAKNRPQRGDRAEALGLSVKEAVRTKRRFDKSDTYCVSKKLRGALQMEYYVYFGGKDKVSVKELEELGLNPDTPFSMVKIGQDVIDAMEGKYSHLFPIWDKVDNNSAN